MLYLSISSIFLPAVLWKRSFLTYASSSLDLNLLGMMFGDPLDSRMRTWETLQSMNYEWYVESHDFMCLFANQKPQIKVISVFEYLNAEFVNRHLLTTHGGVQYEFGIFQTAVNKVYGQRDFNAPRLWRNFMQNFMSRMAQWVSTWVNTRIDELLVTWRQVQNAAASGSNAHNIATTYITQLEQLREQVRIRAVFDASAFIYMGGTGS